MLREHVKLPIYLLQGSSHLHIGESVDIRRAGNQDSYSDGPEDECEDPSQSDSWRMDPSLRLVGAEMHISQCGYYS